MASPREAAAMAAAMMAARPPPPARGASPDTASAGCSYASPASKAAKAAKVATKAAVTPRAQSSTAKGKKLGVERSSLSQSLFACFSPSGPAGGGTLSPR
jgi:hypothetical protein